MKIKKNSSGKYSVKVQIGKYENGRIRYKIFIANTKAEVEEKEKAYFYSLRIAELDAKDPLLRDFLTDILENERRYDLKPSSYDREKTTLENQIKPNIGHYRLSELTEIILIRELVNRIIEKSYQLQPSKKP